MAYGLNILEIKIFIATGIVRVWLIFGGWSGEQFEWGTV